MKRYWRWAALLRLLTFVLVFILVWAGCIILGFRANNNLRREYSTQVTAQVIWVSAKTERRHEFLDFLGSGALSHRKAELEFTSPNGEKWYSNLPMSASVAKGRQVRAWLPNHNPKGEVLFEKEFIENSNGVELLLVTPWLSDWDVVRNALMPPTFGALIILVVELFFSRRRRSAFSADDHEALLAGSA